jgi:P27 family predicted phage terminase small subunit
MFGKATDPKLKIEGGAHTDRPASANFPDCPDFLDVVAKAKWPELCKGLAETGLLTNAGRDVMAMYCSAFSQWREATDMVKKSGLIIKGPGGVCANPCVKIAADAKQEMLQLAELLGLEPSGHSRLRVKRGLAVVPREATA